MDVNPFISEKQLKDSMGVCPYCNKNISELRFESTFDLNSLYKELQCNCGRKISFKMSWIGSGHDNWEKRNNLDKRIEEVEQNH